MITSINIVNYKGINDCEIKLLNNVSVFYGKNGVGKTRILKFIKDFQNYIISGPKNIENIEGSITFNKKIWVYLKIENFELVNFEVKKNSNEVISIDDNGKVNFFNLISEDVYSSQNRNLIKEYIKLLKTSPLNTFIMTIADDKSKHQKKLIDILPEWISLIASSNIITEVQMQDELLFNKIKDNWKVKDIIKTKQNNQKEILWNEKKYIKFKSMETKFTKILSTIDSNIQKYFVEKDDEKIDINHKLMLTNGDIYSLYNENISHGVQHLFEIIIPIYDLLKSTNSTLIIDEFDPYLHDFLYYSLVSNILEEIDPTSQIIFVSHNSNIINMLPFKSIFIVQNELNSDKVIVENPNISRNTKTTNVEKQYKEGKILRKEIYDSDFMEFWSD